MANVEQLAPGDRVFVCFAGGWNATLEIDTVEKVQKLHLTLVGLPGKWNRKTGRMVGANVWSRKHLTPFSEQEWAEYQDRCGERDARNILSNFDWRRCERDLAMKVFAMLPKPPEVSK